MSEVDPQLVQTSFGPLALAPHDKTLNKINIKVLSLAAAATTPGSDNTAHQQTVTRSAEPSGVCAAAWFNKRTSTMEWICPF